MKIKSLFIDPVSSSCFMFIKNVINCLKIERDSRTFLFLKFEVFQKNKSVFFSVYVRSLTLYQLSVGYIFSISLVWFSISFE